MVMLSPGSAQERDLKLAAAVGQPAPPPVLESAPSRDVRRSNGRHALGHRRDVSPRPVVLARDLADQPPGRESAPDLSGRYADARLQRRRPPRGHGDRARSGRPGRRRRRPPLAARSRASRSRTRSRRFRTRRCRRSCRAPSCWTRSELAHLPYIVAHRERPCRERGPRRLCARHRRAARAPCSTSCTSATSSSIRTTTTMLGYRGHLHRPGTRPAHRAIPRRCILLDSTREAFIGDYLLTEEDVTPGNFFRTRPRRTSTGESSP